MIFYDLNINMSLIDFLLEFCLSCPFPSFFNDLFSFSRAENFVTYFDLGMKAIQNTDAEHKITFAVIRTGTWRHVCCRAFPCSDSLVAAAMENEYVLLTKMKFHIPPKNPMEYGRVLVAPLSALNDAIVRGFQELEA